MLEHQASVDQVELGPWKLIRAHVDTADLDRVESQRLDETGVEVDGSDGRAASGHPLDQRAAARAHFEASPAAPAPRRSPGRKRSRASLRHVGLNARRGPDVFEFVGQL